MTEPDVSPALLDAAQTAARLPYPALADAIERLLLRGDNAVQVPPRLVQPLGGGASLFVMPACDDRLAIAKLITFTPRNAGSARRTIQGDVLVFDVATGERVLLLDGPTVTARRTAAVSLLAARRLAPNPHGPLLLVGAGVQARAHLDAFAAGLGVRAVRIVSRGAAGSAALAAYGESLGLDCRVVLAADAALADCPLAVTATSAAGVVLRGPPRADAFIAAVGAFTPEMVELDAALCHHFARIGHIVLDTADARHEAGDLLQAGLDPARFATLAELVRDDVAAAAHRAAPVLFKSCGWAGWELAAARLALATDP